MRIMKTAELEMKAIFHWLKTGDDDIFVVRYSNYSRPTVSLFTISEISAKSAVFPRDSQKNTFSMSTKSAKNRRGRKNVPKEYTHDVTIIVKLLYRATSRRQVAH